MYQVYNESNPLVLGIDHGYGNIKTSHSCFTTGVSMYEKEPVFKSNMLIYDGKYYIIGEDHKEFFADKMLDEDYYILTLAAIAREMHGRQITTACVYLAVGLPLTWVSEQKDGFKKYLLKNSHVDFIFRGIEYSVTFVGADVFPQGFSAVANRLSEFRGINMLCDIGNGTMNIMYINNGKPVSSKCYTEKFGTYQCMLTVRETLMRKFGTSVEDTAIEEVLRYGKTDIAPRYLEMICDAARTYAAGIMRRLREHEYNPEVMRLYVMGGGSCLIQNFGVFDKNRVTINDDICATAKGYEELARYNLRKKGVQKGNEA